MKRLFTLLGMLAAFVASAQINRMEYYWDTDPGFGSGIALPILQNDSIAAVHSFSTVGLQPGVHTLYVRSRDVQNRWSVASKKAIRINEPVFPIAHAEYFFDTDPGFGQGIPLTITSGDSIAVADALPTNALAPGVHTLYIRVRDTNGKWSPFSKRLVHILQPTFDIAEAEYFFDTDPGFGNGTAITITQGDSIDLTPALATDSLAPGIHTAYIRVKSSNGEWSPFSKRLLHIQYPEAPVIVAAEYFVDSDPGFGNGTAIPLTSEGDSVLASFDVPTDTLSLGIHMVYVRTKYSNDQWSTNSKKLIYIDNPADDPITAAEYFFDTDPGVGNATPITINSGDSVLTNFSAPTSGLLIGAHWIHVRVRDAEGRWSAYSRDSFYVDNFNCLVYGNGEIELTGDTCRGTELTLRDKTIFNSGVDPEDFSFEWNFSNDTATTYTDSVVNVTFNQTGIYTATLKIVETGNPVCQEIVTKTFTIRRIDSTFSNVNICDGDSVLAGGAYQKVAGTYYNTYANRYGCDSVHGTIVSVTANVTPAITINTSSLNVCEGFSTLFSAVPDNGGSTYYIWKINGVVVGQGYHFQGWFQYSTTTLVDGDVVTCDLVSDVTCTTADTVTSNALVMNVTPDVAASITIDVDVNDFCSGTLATFTVTDTAFQGENPQYVWYVNNFIAQNGGTTYSTTSLGNGDLVRCLLYSDALCVNNSPVFSNTITMNVFTSGFPDISIQASTNSVCYATPITFTAFSSFGGANPTFQWFLNDTLVQSGASNTYASDTLDHEDEVRCVLLSDLPCRLADTDTSNTVTMDIIYNLPVSVTLIPSGNDLCAGTGVNFSANPVNQGSATYEFFVNGVSVQNGNLLQYGYLPQDNDSVWVVVTSATTCATNNPATSNKVHMTMVSYDTVSVSITATDDTICQGTNVKFTATATNPGINPTYLWRVNGFQAQVGAADTFNTTGLGNGNTVTCEVYGTHQCTTPYPAVSNILSVTVIDTMRPSALISIPQTTICQGTEVSFDATLTNESANPTVQWLVNNSVVQTGGLNYTSSTLQDFDVVRLRLTVDYACPVQNPVLSNPVTMTVIDSVTPAVFVYHGPNPACPGNLVSVFTVTTTGGNAPTYEFSVNGNPVQSGVNSQYNSSAFVDGDVVQVTMTSNAECVRTPVAVSNPDTIRIIDFIPAGVSIQVSTAAQCIGETAEFKATGLNGGLTPIYTWRVNNAVFQSGTADTFATAALQNGDSVYCEMNSVLSCATNNPAVSNKIFIQLQSCISCDSIDCTDGDLCTVDTCINGVCSNPALDCSDGNACTIDKCDEGICDHAPVICNDNSLCTSDLCDANGGDCLYIPMDCNDNNACSNDLCVDSLGECVYTSVICLPDVDLCTIEECDNLLGCISVPISCDDGDLCTNDLCQDGQCSNPPVVCTPPNACFTSFCLSGQCINVPVLCTDGNACTDDNCDILLGCVYTVTSCNDASACTLDSCNQQSGCFHTAITCDDSDACTTDGCDTSTGCAYTPAFCFDLDPCTINGCDPLTGCTVTPANCDDQDACTTDQCVSPVGCWHTAISCLPDFNPCTIDACDSVLGCTYAPVGCDDQDPCTNDVCLNPIGCIYSPNGNCTNICDTLVCDDADLCTTDNCDSLTGCGFTVIPGCGVNQCDTLSCTDANTCTVDGCDSIIGCIFPQVNCNDLDACTNDFCINIFGCLSTPIPGCANPCDLLVCDDGHLCTTDDCDSLTGCIFNVIPGCADPCDTLTCTDSDLCTTDTCRNGACIYPALDCDDNEPCSLDHCDAGICIHTFLAEPIAANDASFTVYESGLPGGSDTDPNNPNAPVFPQPVTASGNVLVNDTIDCQSAITQVSFNAITYTPDANGVITINAGTGTFTLYTRNYNGQFAGDIFYTLTSPATHTAGAGNNSLTQQFRYTLEDLAGNTDNAIITVSIVDDVPQTFSRCYNAVPDSLVVIGNTQINDVAGADTSLTLMQVSLEFGSPFPAASYIVNHPELTGASLNGNAVVIPVPNAVITTRLGGSLEINPDGSFIYALNPLSAIGAIDDIYCTYTDADGDKATDTLCFTIVALDSCSNLDCNDNDACTADDCISGQCVNTTINCDDHTACTTEICNTQSGCIYTPVDCNDNNACTNEFCTPASGCQYPAIDCNDNNACTLDSCGAQTGCFYTNVVCNDSDPCTDDVCNNPGGCESTPRDCNDNSACTLDSCNTQSGCFFTTVVCNDNNACTDDVCDTQSGCQFTTRNCNDSNLCTTDACNTQTGCTNTAITCNDNDLCTTDTCNALVGCVFMPVSCVDNDLCTVDKCEFGVCVNVPLTCNDGDTCTIDTCIGGSCFFLPVTCDDNNVCTTDTCSFGCLFTPVSCDDGDGCTNDDCNAQTGCFHTTISCDDGEICTFDFCANGSCFHDCDTNANHELIWQKALGGSSADEAHSVHQTTDGGYIVTGHTFSNNGDVSGNNGQSDFWAARLDANGTLLWQNALGGGKSESANAVRQTSDGGFILAGNSKSNDADVSGNHGGEDFWVVKLSSAGTLQWQKSFGGNNADIANAVEQTTDGGYVVAGWTSSNNQNVSGNHGGSDYWVIKLDAAGNLQWQKALGGTASDQAHDVQQTADGGYIVIGNTKSNNGQVSGNHGQSDYWAVKLDGAGSIQWQKALGGSKAESASAVRQSADGGYVIAGSSGSDNGDVSGNHGDEDYWIVKLDGSGNLLWEKNYGGSGDDIARSVSNTADGGCIVAGSSKSNDGDVSGNHGNDDFWVIRLDANGDLLWEKSLGGNKKDQAYSTQQTNDEGFVIAGFTDSHNNGDVTGHHSSSDFWVVKLASDRMCRPVTMFDIAICPGDSVLVGTEYYSASGTYYDSLTNHIGCDSTIVVNLTIADCDDNDPCTIDACSNGGCTNTPVICDDGDICSVDDCDAAHNGCFYTPVVCNDNDPCTDDVCTSGTCQYEDVICNDNNDCTTDACVNGVCAYMDERRVLSFTLVDATADTDLGLLNDGDVIDLFVTGPINIRADVCATSNIESVRFMLNGSNYVMENIPFYTIAGDNAGNYNAWNVTPGVYTIRAIPYSGNNGAGITGIYNEITITIIDGTPPCSGNARKVVDFTLVSAATETDIMQLVDGAVIDLSVTGPINVRANVCLENNIESVRFLLNGSSYVMENIPFYTIAGDNNGNYNAWNVQPGVYTIRAIPYSGNNGAGTVGDYHEVTITIIGGVPPCQAGQNRVFSFTLVDADDDIDISALTNGAVIDLNVTGPINVRADVCANNIVESVKFLLNGAPFRTESEAPYLLAGDNNGNYHTWNVQPGVYTIKATPYTGNNGTGTAGSFHEITITVISGGAAKMAGTESLGSAATSETQVSAYPNPFRDKLFVEFTLAEASRVKLEIFSVTGQKVAELFEGDIRANELQRFEFKPGTVSDGVFMYRLQTAQGTYYGKALMVK